MTSAKNDLEEEEEDEEEEFTIKKEPSSHLKGNVFSCEHSCLPLSFRTI